MPTYGYVCTCGLRQEMLRPIDERNALPVCVGCQQEMQRELYPTPARFAGRVVQGGGPDRFTADVMGIPLKDLPDGLRTK